MRPTKRVAESPLNGPWNRVFANSQVEVRYREDPRERIVVAELPGSKPSIRVAVFKLEELQQLDYIVFGWVFDKLDFIAGKIPASLDFDRVVKLLHQAITNAYLGRHLPKPTPALLALLRAMPERRELAAAQFFPHGSGEVELHGDDFKLKSDPTYFEAAGPGGRIENQNAQAAVALYALITGRDVPRVRQVRREIESLDLAGLPNWLARHDIQSRPGRAASRRASEEAMSLAGRGFVLEADSSSFRASSTLAEDVEESFEVRSLGKGAAARLWGILRDVDARQAARVEAEIEQLDFAELPGWLRKRGVEYDLDRGWKDLNPKTAAHRVANPLSGPWSGSEANAAVEVRWEERAGHEVIAVVEVPQRGMRTVRVARFDLSYGPGTLYASNVLLAAGLAHGIPPSETYEKVRDDIARALIRDAERVAEDVRGYPDNVRGMIEVWHRHPYSEESVNARLVLPANSPPLKIQAKDYVFVSKPYSFSATMYHSDPHEMEPAYSNIHERSPFMALSLYKKLTSPGGDKLQHAIQGTSWGQLEAFLAKMGITAEHSSSVRR